MLWSQCRSHFTYCKLLDKCFEPWVAKRHQEKGGSGPCELRQCLSYHESVGISRPVHARRESSPVGQSSWWHWGQGSPGEDTWMSPTMPGFQEPVPECSQGGESKQREATPPQVQLSISPLSFLLHTYFQSQSKLKLAQHLLIAWYPTELSQNQGLIRDPSRGVRMWSTATPVKFLQAAFITLLESTMLP